MDLLRNNLLISIQLLKSYFIFKNKERSESPFDISIYDKSTNYTMTYGLPIVSFNCEFGPSELIVEDINGFLVEPFNVNELANKICLLICDDEITW